MGKTPNILDNDAKIDTKVTVEHIGYFSVSLSDLSVLQIVDLMHFMRGHGIHMQKSNEDPSDDWWFFTLPQGSTRALQEDQADVPRYTVRLLDGYSFTLEMGPLNRDHYFTSPPRLFLDTQGEGEGHG